MKHAIILAAATALMTPGSLLAQTTTAQPTPNAQGGQQPAGTALKAADFVRQAAIGGLFEVQSSQLATTKSTNDQVRQFGQRMVRDHTDANQKLKDAAGTQTVPTTLDQAHQQKMQQLQQASAQQFDRLYIDMQMDAHRESVDLFDRYGREGDNAQLKQFAQATLPTLREHMQAVERIQGSLPRVSSDVGAQPGHQQARAGQDSGTVQDAQAGRIVVQQPAPTVRVDQGSPVVTVQPTRPTVTVRQPQPEIVVRQAQPTVTIDMPQPEIIVRMPKPDVDVAMQQPEVRVNQPQPTVQVAQPRQQPQVDVQQGQPQVRLQSQANAEPQVTVVPPDGQPNVRYERAEPRVVVNNPQGQPTVRFEREDEQTDRAAAGQRQGGAAVAVSSDQRDAAATDAARQRPPAGADTRQSAMGRDTAGAAGTQGGTTGSVASTAEAGQSLSVDRLTAMNLYNARGNELGDVERVVAGSDGRHYVVIGAGGFLGIGEREVPVPVDRLTVQGDRLVIQGVTEDEIKAMPAYRSGDATYRNVGGNQSIRLGAAR